MDVVLFGTGKYYQKYHHYFAGVNILAVLDNDEKKQGKYIDDVSIIHPKCIQGLQFDYIFILTRSITDVRNQLLLLGVEEEKIKNVYDIKKELLSNNVEKYPPHIFFFTNNLSATGAPVVMLSAAIMYQNKGYDVTVITAQSGPLLQELCDSGVKVLIDASVMIFDLRYFSYIPKNVIVFLNTIEMFYLMENIPEDVLVVWWIHDAEEYYKNKDFSIINNVLNNKNILVRPVSLIAKKIFIKYFPSKCVSACLPYGIQDDASSWKQKDNEKICFGFVGSITYRKGIDILLNAIKMLDKAVIKQCDFSILGSQDDEFSRNVIHELCMIDNVKVYSPLSHNCMQDFYKTIDVLVVPSREDPLPVVATEAMMYSIPCLVSDGTGTADYISDEKNGFICERGSVQSLIDAILKIIEKKELLPFIGKEARRIYEENFTMKKFSEALIEIVSTYP